MKKLNLLIHPGFGKTATTWMQESVFPNLKKCINLGKPTTSQKLHEAQYQLFNDVHGSTLYNARNSERLINKYVETLSQEIIQRFPRSENNGYFIVSDETIFCYTNYHGELNTFLLGSTLRKLRESLDSFCETSVSILITFREQYSVLKSMYAFDYTHQTDRFPTFDKFLNYGINNHHSSIFGSLWYDEVYNQLKSIFKGDKLIFVPYEFLLENKILFLEKSLLDFGVSDLDELKEISSTVAKEAKNVNHTDSGKYMLRGTSKRRQLLTYVRQRKHLIPEKYYPILKSIRHYLEPYFGNHTVIKGNIFDDDEKNKKMIQDIYGNSNRLLSNMICVDLGALGYSIS
jgi:hypothetical protein